MDTLLRRPLPAPGDEDAWTTYREDLARLLPKTFTLTLTPDTPDRATVHLPMTLAPGELHYALTHPVTVPAGRFVFENLTLLAFGWSGLLGQGPDRPAWQAAVDRAWDGPHGLPQPQLRLLLGHRHLVVEVLRCIQDQDVEESLSLLDDLRLNLLGLALTDPTLTEEQVRVGAALTETWRGTPGQLPDTIAALTTGEAPTGRP